MNDTHSTRLIIWANDIKVSLVKHLFNHVLHGLFGRPRPGRFRIRTVRAVGAREAGVDPSGTGAGQDVPPLLSRPGMMVECSFGVTGRRDSHEEVGRAIGSRGVSQFVSN